MVSYTQFRDLSSVFGAGNGLVSAGEGVGADLETRLNSIRTGEKAVLLRRDDYGTMFWNDTYAAPGEDGGKPRNEGIFESAESIVEAIKTIGPDVVMACSALTGADAAHGAALLQATTVKT